MNSFVTAPILRLSQSLYPENGDAFMYFTKIVQEEKGFKRVPCLLTNDKKEIRLDQLSKKDEQSLILINNKYELLHEIKSDVAGHVNVSLHQDDVERWVKGKTSEVEIEPATIIKEMETFVKDTFYTSPKVTKVLALWMYATYYYSMFTKGFPYLVIKEKEYSAKATLEFIVQVLSFNSTHALHISEAALYNHISFLGGTVIFDDFRDIYSDDDNFKDMILKGGFANNGKVYRYNSKTGSVQGFNLFGPKVFASAEGIEDLISNRSVNISLPREPESNIKPMFNTHIYNTHISIKMRSVTSKAAISALAHFERVNESFLATHIESEDISEVFKPLFAIAKVAGGDYEEHLTNFLKEN